MKGEEGTESQKRLGSHSWHHQQDVRSCVAEAAGWALRCFPPPGTFAFPVFLVVACGCATAFFPMEGAPSPGLAPPQASREPLPAAVSCREERCLKTTGAWVPEGPRHGQAALWTSVPPSSVLRARETAATMSNPPVLVSTSRGSLVHPESPPTACAQRRQRGEQVARTLGENSEIQADT